MASSYRELYEKGMRRVQEADALDLLDLGGETRSQNRLNREYMESLTFEMRLMGSGFASTASTIAGHEVGYPIQVAAISDGRLLNRLASYWEAPALEEIATGAADAGTWIWVGEMIMQRLQRIIDCGAPVVKVVKPAFNSSWDETDDNVYQLKEAEARGCIAVGMDIDVFFGEKTGDEPPYRYSLGPQTMEQMQRYVEATSLPFFVKGVLSVQDALKCKEIGAQGIVVSHHGGEAIDYAVPILRVLPHIRAACPDMTILAETGFRRGTDILKALALGADGVCLLSILLIAYVAAGRQGITDMLHVLAEELSRNMSLCGARSIADIDESIIWRPYPDASRGESA